MNIRKRLTIKQSGKSVNVHGPISKSGNKYMKKKFFIL